MTLTLLQINDHGLHLATEDGETRTETGYIREDHSGLVSGANAYATAWANPHLCYNRYWHELNQKPLQRKSKFARNHADMAYIQLKNILYGITDPQVLLSVPGSLDNDKLAILLGLLQAVPAKICGIVDNGLLANMAEHRLFIELQLHQALLTEFEIVNGYVNISGHEIIPELGVLAIYHEMAQYISKQMIAANRYDPLHSPESQQQVYNAIPAWLIKIINYPDFTVTLESPSGAISIKLNRTEFAKTLYHRFDLLDKSLKKYAPNKILLGPEAEILNSFNNVLAQANKVDNPTIAQRGFSLVRSGEFSSTSLRRTLCLKSSVRPEYKTEVSATHIVYAGSAWHIDDPLSFQLLKEGLIISRDSLRDADLIIAKSEGRLKILHKNDDVEVAAPEELVPGEWLVVGGHKLQLIEIHDA